MRSIEVFEAHALLIPKQLYGSGWTIAMFRDNDLGDVLFVLRKLIISVIPVCCFAIDKQNNVRILLDAVMNNDIVRDKVMRTRNCRIIDILDPKRCD